MGACLPEPFSWLGEERPAVTHMELWGGLGRGAPCLPLACRARSEAPPSVAVVCAVLSVDLVPDGSSPGSELRLLEKAAAPSSTGLFLKSCQQCLSHRGECSHFPWGPSPGSSHPEGRAPCDAQTEVVSIGHGVLWRESVSGPELQER